jgi:N-glycosylase/DNA lyase
MFSNNSKELEPSPIDREKSVQELQTLYGEKRDAIQTRLKEFREILNRNDNDVFAELCFCLLTPQSSAKTCWAAVSRLRERSLLLKGEAKEIQPQLNDVRFGDSKAKYIVEARATFTKGGKLYLKSHLSSFTNPFELREWMVENVKGLGYKEASHFLRNVGLGEEFAILDRHILRNLKRLEVIPEVPVSITKKRYLEVEEKLRRFSREIGIPLADLDLLFWSRETGWIFK